MKSLVLTLLVLLIAVTIGRLVFDEPGFVVIGYHGQLIRTSFTFFLILLMAAMFVLYLLVRLILRLWGMPSRMTQWSREHRGQKAQQDLTNGLTALAGGYWKQAESLLLRHAPMSNAPGVHYLAAARAAQSQAAMDRRDNYLRLAQESMPKAEIPVGLSQAELNIQQGELEQAREILMKLRAIDPAHEEVLLLCLKVCMTLSRWQDVLELLPALAKRKVLSKDELAALQISAYTGLLGQAASADALEQAWSRAPSALQQHRAVLESYVMRLQSLGQGNKAIPLIQKFLRKNWSPALVRLYGLMEGDDGKAQLVEAERWLKAHGDDPELLLALARLSFRSNLWGKARSYAEASLQKDSRPESYRLLAESLDKMGQAEGVLECYRKGLQLATR
jgi:HemY protein